MISIHTIETIIAQHKHDIDSLGIPDLIHSSTISINQSPYILQYKLNSIRNSLNNLNYKIYQNLKTNKLYHQIKLQIDNLLVNEIDEKEYIIRKSIRLFEFENKPIESNSDGTDDVRINDEASNEPGIINGEDLSSLRKRLLSGSTRILEDEEQSSDIKLNEYHDSVQNEIISDLSELTTQLKSSAMKLSSKILNDDLIILNETNENIIKNSNLFKIIDKNLGSYLENKTGGKISIWLLLKLFIILAISFVVMILFISIIPRIR